MTLIHTHSHHNDITLLDIAGSSTAYSRNGNLKIGFNEVADDTQLDFEAYNGFIDLSLPDSTALSTAIASGASNCLTAFTIDPAEGSDRPDSILTKIALSPTMATNMNKHLPISHRNQDRITAAQFARTLSRLLLLLLVQVCFISHENSRSGTD